VEEAGPHPAWRILYGVVVALVALGGVVTIVEWAGRGGELPDAPIPGWMLALGAAGLMAALAARALNNWRRERDLNPR
jgi:hypothetical protein